MISSLDIGRQLPAAMRARFCFEASMTAMVFAPDWRRTSSVTVGTPLSRASERCSLVPSSAQPMSRMRIGDAVDGRDDQIVESFADQRFAPSCAAFVRARRWSHCRRECRRSGERWRRARR